MTYESLSQCYSKQSIDAIQRPKAGRTLILPHYEHFVLNILVSMWRPDVYFAHKTIDDILRWADKSYLNQTLASSASFTMYEKQSDIDVRWTDQSIAYCIANMKIAIQAIGTKVDVVRICRVWCCSVVCPLSVQLHDPLKTKYLTWTSQIKISNLDITETQHLDRSEAAKQAYVPLDRCLKIRHFSFMVAQIHHGLANQAPVSRRVHTQRAGPSDKAFPNMNIHARVSTRSSSTISILLWVIVRASCVRPTSDDSGLWVSVWVVEKGNACDVAPHIGNIRMVLSLLGSDL